MRALGFGASGFGERERKHGPAWRREAGLWRRRSYRRGVDRNADSLLSRDELASALCLSAEELAELERDEKPLPCWLTRGAVRFSLAEVTAWHDGRRSSSEHAGPRRYVVGPSRLVPANRLWWQSR
jgi:hypothetical protein